MVTRSAAKARVREMAPLACVGAIHRRVIAAEREISVLVVEHDSALCAGIAAMIENAPGIAPLGAAGSLAAARAVLSAKGAPDVAVIDLGLPDGDGTELIAELARCAPDTASKLAVNNRIQAVNRARATGQLD